MEREKLTVTIRKDLFPQIDAVIDGEKIRNRSHATEYLIQKGLGHTRIRRAFILAGGQGTRLRPLTYELPPPLIPVHGEPLLAHVFRLLAKYDIRDIVLSVGYKKEKIKEALSDGKRYGVNIRYIEEKEPLGTAGPLNLAKPYLQEPFFLIWGDILTSFDLADFSLFHRKSNGLATLAVTSIADPSKLGVVTMQGNRIVDFLEKPKKGEEPTKLVSAGYAICEPEIIDYIPRGRASMEQDVYPRLAHEGRLIGYQFSGPWFDMNTTKNYEKALQDWPTNHI